MTTRRALSHVAAYQGVWIISALGAAHGFAFPGVVAALILAAVRVIFTQDRHNFYVTAVIAVVVGFVAETALSRTGLIVYAAPWPDPRWAPIWIVGLWLAFAVSLEATGALLGKDAIIPAILLGAVFGPLAYVAGARMGALTLASPVWIGLCALAALWAVAFPTLLALSSGRRPTLSIRARDRR